MQSLKVIAASTALLSLCGCQSLAVMALKNFDEKPYSLPVAAEQLELAAQPVDTPPATAAAEIAPADTSPAAEASTAETLIVAEAAPEPEPVRTDVRGQGDGAMTD